VTALRKALAALKRDGTRAERDPSLRIRIGLEEPGGTTFPNDLVEPERTGGEKLGGTEGYDEDETPRSRRR
jgi:hypothetical protein